MKRLLMCTKGLLLTGCGQPVATHLDHFLTLPKLVKCFTTLRWYGPTHYLSINSSLSLFVAAIFAYLFNMILPWLAMLWSSQKFVRINVGSHCIFRLSFFFCFCLFMYLFLFIGKHNGDYESDNVIFCHGHVSTPVYGTCKGFPFLLVTSICLLFRGSKF